MLYVDIRLSCMGVSVFELGTGPCVSAEFPEEAGH